MRSLAGLSGLLALVGALDAARGGHWDQFALLAAIFGSSLLALWLGRRSQPAVRLRPDLLQWVRRHGATTDEAVSRIADRAVAAYRDQFVPDGSDHDSA